MSVVGNNRVGIPIVALHDAEGAVIEVETKNGDLVRGLLFEAEDMMNLYIKNAIVTDSKGVKRRTNQVYLRGPDIVLIVLPDMLKHAPMFNVSTVEQFAHQIGCWMSGENARCRSPFQSLEGL
jgi:small nuclear ribonucleoprotein D3